MKKYTVQIYEDSNGNSPMKDWIRQLNDRPTKENKSLLKKVYYQIERLEYEGTFLGAPITKKIEGKIWELRPVPYRVFFAVLTGNDILLLHPFRKQTQRTPQREINQAQRELNDWLERHEEE